jgi:uncharacterized membrane protein
MRDLIAVGFPGKYRATEVLEQLQALDWKGKIDLKDAVAVYRTEDGRLRVDSSVQPTGKEGGVAGGLLGALLGGILAAPFTVGASAAVAAGAVVAAGAATFGTAGALIGAADAEDWKATWGVPEDFVQEVGGMVQPGTSAVFAQIEASDPRGVVERFRGSGGTVLRTGLKPAAAKKLQETMTAGTEKARK